MSENVKVVIERLDPDVILPTYTHEGDSGMDIRANEDTYIYPGKTDIVKTGFKVKIPEGYELVVRPRSGLSAKTFLRVSNSPGTIDSNYRNEVGVILTNTSTISYDINTPYLYLKDGKEYLYENGGIYAIKKGDRIAQLVLQRVPKVEWVEGKVDVDTDRGLGGFGSTGV
jgi:dUTP pyrophosphatase